MKPVVRGRPDALQDIAFAVDHDLLEKQGAGLDVLREPRAATWSAIAGELDESVDGDGRQPVLPSYCWASAISANKERPTSGRRTTLCLRRCRTVDNLDRVDLVDRMEDTALRPNAG